MVTLSDLAGLRQVASGEGYGFCRIPRPRTTNIPRKLVDHGGLTLLMLGATVEPVKRSSRGSLVVDPISGVTLRQQRILFTVLSWMS